LELLQYEQIKNKNLNKDIDSMKSIGEKKEKLLELLFNFFNNMKYILNYIPSQKPARKELLNDVILYESLEDFEYKLKELVKKCEKNTEEIRLSLGKYFSCDITCCTTKNERMKYLSKKNKNLKK
jgi:hypothetical protein